MATYRELQEQIRLLTEQAEKARQEEWSAIINEINEKIAEYQIKATDLVFHSEKKSKVKVEGGRKKLPPIFRNPDDPSQTWSGRGKTPSWLAEARKKEGYAEERFLIQS